MARVHYFGVELVDDSWTYSMSRYLNTEEKKVEN